MAYDYNPLCQGEVNAWAFISCYNPVEREAMNRIRVSVQAGFNFLPAEALDEVFQNSSPGWWTRRRDAFLANWDVFLQSIDNPPDPPILGYVCLRVWAASGNDSSVCPGRLGGGAKCPSEGFGYP